MLSAAMEPAREEEARAAKEILGRRAEGGDGWQGSEARRLLGP